MDVDSSFDNNSARMGGMSNNSFLHQQQQQFIGLVVPGGPLHTNFTPADASGQKWTLQLPCPGDLPVPLASVTELVFVLLPNASSILPPRYGVMCYWQITTAVQGVTSTTGFELLGALTPGNPSAVFRTGWSEHEQIMTVVNNNTPVIVTFGLSMEPLDNIQNVIGNGSSSNTTTTGGGINAAMNQQREQNRLLVAQKIAADLFTFMQSFDTGGGGPTGQMLVPNNIFDRWMKRFEARFRRDPNFFLKSSE